MRRLEYKTASPALPGAQASQVYAQMQRGKPLQAEPARRPLENCVRSGRCTDRVWLGGKLAR
jgi:hypothetical protein